MNEGGTIGGTIGEAVVGPFIELQNLPPDRRNARIVSLSAAALGWCGYLAPLGFAIRAGAGAIALFVLIVAFRAAGSVRDPLAMSWRALLGAACVWLLWNGAYPEGWPVAAFLLKGLYIAWLCSNVARFLLAAGLFGSNAQRIIERQLRRENAPMIPVRRRR